MKQYLFASIILCLSLCGFAQTVPQYYYAPQFDDSTLGYQNKPFGLAFVQTSGNPNKDFKDIFIFYPKNFKNPPKGKITALYIWMHEAATTNPTGKFIFSDFYIKMGTTTRDSFGYDAVKKGYKLFDSEKELTTVIQGKPYTITATNLVSYQCHRKWLKLSLQVPFMYDPNKNLVFQYLSEHNDLTDSTQQFINGMGYPDSASLILNRTRGIICLDSAKTFTSSNKMPPSYFVPCIGFDLDTTGVSGVDEIKATSLQLYPNPATATIHFSHSGSYTISTLQGAIVQQGEGDVANIGTLSQGLYIVQLLTKNGERLVGRFLKE